MHNKDAAEIAARIVVAVIQSGKLPTCDVREISAYYTAMHKAVVECDNALKTPTRQASSAIQQ